MLKLNAFTLSFLIIGFVFLFSCQKEPINHNVTSNDGVQARLAYTEKGYTEIEVTPIIKKNCYFSEWNKNILTPVAGLFEYYDAAGDWVASIDFGDGSCDHWATKTWDTEVFSDYPSGTDQFSVFNYKGKK